ncbi:Cytosol aminopeptidase [Planctomycetes bacterium Pla163]|uniref:Probable cytosol aminopeptidase n=1 Tax=Rohdeia mirabilis TaxID=2528008 RepID=A0A518D132_9BACT|nr:Cytosol aminopeptidase [Planctomycetes bacterium Pla163]
MKVTVKSNDAKPTATPVLVVLAHEGGALALPAGVELAATAAADFSGRFRQFRWCDPVKGVAERVLLVGLGAREDAGSENLRRATALAVKGAESLGLKRATIHVSSEVAEAAGGAEAAGESVAEAAVMAAYRFDAHKSKPKKVALTAVELQGPGAPFKRGATRGQALGEANCFTRDLQNHPGNVVTPTRLAAEAKKLATGAGQVTCKVLEESDMKKMKMGALLGVSAGSREPAKLIHLVYKPKTKKRGSKKIAIVGKGLTFDAGGISLKPGAKMDEMRYDMSGGAAVLGLFHALRAVGCEHEVHGVVPASENLPDGLATKPGDIHTAMDGTTIEVLNTDAEGRLILADALCYTTAKIKPETIIDVATLTGAVIMALGHELTGMFPTTDDLRQRLTEAGDAVAEKVWPLPLLDCHKDQMKGASADLRNINSPGQGNGSTSGAAFLSNFVGDTEWCHLDIAGTAWGTLDRDYVGGAMGTGVGVRLLMEFLRRR